MDLLEINKNDKILIIAPHPDDECIGTGGLLVKYSKQCCVLVMTDGRQGQGDMPPEYCKKIRKNEFMSEMNILSIFKYSFLDIQDGTLMNHLDCLEQFDMNDYTKIFVTSDKDNHEDHAAAFLALMRALKAQNNVNSVVYLYEVHNPQGCPTDYLNITQEIGQKINLVRCHKSQLGKMPYDRYVYVQALYRGLQNRMSNEYIEVYTRISREYNADEEKVQLENQLQKYKQFYYILTRWMKATGNLNNLKKMNVSSCAIYGYAELGEILELYLNKSGIKVSYILDKVKKETNTGLEIFYPGEEPIREEVIIVTAIYYFESIKKELTNMGYSKIISLKDIIENIQE